MSTVSGNFATNNTNTNQKSEKQENKKPAAKEQSTLFTSQTSNATTDNNTHGEQNEEKKYSEDEPRMYQNDRYEQSMVGANNDGDGYTTDDDSNYLADVMLMIDENEDKDKDSYSAEKKKTITSGKEIQQSTTGIAKSPSNSPAPPTKNAKKVNIFLGAIKHKMNRLTLGNDSALTSDGSCLINKSDFGKVYNIDALKENGEKAFQLLKKADIPPATFCYLLDIVFNAANRNEGNFEVRHIEIILVICSEGKLDCLQAKELAPIIIALATHRYNTDENTGALPNGLNTLLNKMKIRYNNSRILPHNRHTNDIGLYLKTIGTQGNILLGKKAQLFCLKSPHCYLCDYIELMYHYLLQSDFIDTLETIIHGLGNHYNKDPINHDSTYPTKFSEVDLNKGHHRIFLRQAFNSIFESRKSVDAFTHSVKDLLLEDKILLQNHIWETLLIDSRNHNSERDVQRLARLKIDPIVVKILSALVKTNFIRMVENNKIECSYIVIRLMAALFSCHNLEVDDTDADCRQNNRDIVNNKMTESYAWFSKRTEVDTSL